MVSHFTAQPYEDPSANSLQMLCLFQLVVTLFCGLLIKTEVNVHDEYEMQIFTGILVISNSAVIISGLLIIFFGAKVHSGLIGRLCSKCARLFRGAPVSTAAATADDQIDRTALEMAKLGERHLVAGITKHDDDRGQV
jgi:hypothetical protein